MDVTPGEDGINLLLHAKEGTQIDVNEIERCLDYTVAKVSEGDDASS